MSSGIVRVATDGAVAIFATGFSPAVLGSGLTGLAFGPDGDLYVADIGANKIYRISGPVPVLSCVDDGFLPPFDVQLELKKKAKRAIPVKMMLVDESGFPITDMDISAPVVNVAYGALGPPFDGYDADLVPSGLADDGNEFRYDPETETWIINLATKQFTASGTYTVMRVGVASTSRMTAFSMSIR
jgi:hypothetical protein